MKAKTSLMKLSININRVDQNVTKTPSNLSRIVPLPMRKSILEPKYEENIKLKNPTNGEVIDFKTL